MRRYAASTRVGWYRSVRRRNSAEKLAGTTRPGPRRGEPRPGAPSGALARAIKFPLSGLIGLPQLAALYAGAHGRTALEVAKDTLDRLEFHVAVDAAELAQIPTEGPVVAVANHPLGGPEGLALAILLGRARPDVKLFGNFLLAGFTRLRDLFIFVNPFDTPKARHENVRGMKDALRWLRDGHLLGVFPSGEVSHLDVRVRHITDPIWSSNVAGLARRTGATVVPMYFSGANGAVFQMAGLLHPRLRSALLAREMMAKRDRVCDVHIGTPIRPEMLAEFATDEDAIEFLRLRTYALAGREPRRRRRTRQRRHHRVAQALAPIAPPIAPEVLAAEVAAFPEEALLSASRELSAYCVRAEHMPHLMTELGRLREVTFRGVGEGTGQPLDLDPFDRTYRHLLLWNPTCNMLVGGYRLGLTDELLAQGGKRALYVESLFELSDEFLDRLGPAVELGRSFVRPECQKQVAPMVLLWQGVAQFLSRQQRYRRMFGPVSVSNNYRPASRALIMSFLSRPPYLSELAPLAKPRMPFNPKRWLSHDVRSRLDYLRTVEDLNHVVADIEPDGKGIPPLLRQYLKMGAKVVGFNLDPEFGNCLDGLCVFDAAGVDRRVVRRYASEDEVDRFKTAHGTAEAPDC